jgi:uncharacterized membrane protein YqjE
MARGQRCRGPALSQTNIPTARVDLVGSPAIDEKTLPELLSTMTSDLTTLMRKEIELAKVEAKEEAAKAGKAAGMLAAGGLAAHMALIFVSLAAAWLLDTVMPESLAFLLVGIAYAIAAVVLGKIGQERMKEVRPVPEQTIETLKEDVQWARAQKS